MKTKIHNSLWNDKCVMKSELYLADEPTRKNVLYVKPHLDWGKIHGSNLGCAEREPNILCREVMDESLIQDTLAEQFKIPNYFS
jgi:hypothetical protein